MANEKNSLLYGIRDGNPVYIRDLDATKDKGLRCRCTCPKCGDLLEARLNFKDPNRVRYFAHYNPVKCDIVRANQTAIHLMAKNIVAKEKKIMFPAVKVELQGTHAYESLRPLISKLDLEDASNLQKQLEGATPVFYKPADVIEFDKIILEKTISDIIPDIIASKNEQKCLVEIAVTHFVDEEKEQKIRELGISALEIDLSSLVGEDLDEQLLTDIIVGRPEYKKWIHNALVDRENESIEEKARTICQSYIDYYQEKQRIKEEKAEIARRKAKEIALRVERAPQLLHDAFLPENYQKLLQADRNDQQFHDFFKTLTMSTTCPRTPFYVDIPISGEFIFNCDRRIWQSSIFDKFIFNRKLPSNDKDNITCKKIETWINKYQKQFQVRLDYNVECCVDGTWRHLMPDVIDQYLFYLKLMGFISYRRGHNGSGQVKANYALVPPNQPMAKLLRSTINQANPYDPNIDVFVEQHMQREQKDKSEIQWKHELPEVKEQRLRKIREKSLSPQDAIMEGFNPERLEKWLSKIKNDEAFTALYATLPISTKCPDAPFFVDIPIGGEFVFDCDRRIWQSLIFDKFIYGNSESNADNFTDIFKRVCHWITEEQQLFPINQKYNVKYKLSKYDAYSHSLLPEVVWQYLKYLESLGFIAKEYQRGKGTITTIADHTPTPPNFKYAQLLNKAIERANPLDPNLESFIQAYIERRK